MYAYDVNGDGLNDVITALAAHGFGLAWYEQYREGGEIKFREHIIMNKEPRENKYGVKFSELHAIDLVDMDGDGLKDIVTGKRFWSHGRTGDPDRNDAAVLYWFKLVRGADKTVDFVPYLIDDNSGVGTQVVARRHQRRRPAGHRRRQQEGHLRPSAREEDGVARGMGEGAAQTHRAAEERRCHQAQGRRRTAAQSGFRSRLTQGLDGDGHGLRRDARQRRCGEPPPQRHASGHRGEYWVGTYEAHGDAATGTLTSVPFTVTQPYASFLVGGGSGNKTRVELVNAASGQVLFRATGPDNEKMRAVFVDLRAFHGGEDSLRLVDEATTGWGHVNFDDFVFHDSQPVGAESIEPVLFGKRGGTHTTSFFPRGSLSLSSSTL